MFRDINPTIVQAPMEKKDLIKFIGAISEHPELGFGRWFSGGQITKSLRMPKRTCQLLLQKALAEELIRRRGHFKSTQYALDNKVMSGRSN